MSSYNLEQHVPGYTIWHEPGRSHPWRWARDSQPHPNTRYWGCHGGALSFSLAIVAAERHKLSVDVGEDVFGPQPKPL